MNLKTALSLLVVVCVWYAVAQDMDAPQARNSSTVASTDASTTAIVAASTTNTENGTVTESTAAVTTHFTSSSHPQMSTAQFISSSYPETSSAHPTEAPTTKSQSDIWSVQHNGSYCILLKAAISIKFRYNSTKTHQFVTNTTVVPSAATVSGSCDPKDQWIQLNFFKNCSLKMVFMKTNDSKYYQSEFVLNWAVDSDTFPDAPNISGSYKNPTPMFYTSKTGYLCTARITLYDNSSVLNDLSSVYMEKMQLEAFQTKKDAKFSDQYERCKEDTISNLVPIIVGACLGGLIIIVLIAYLIGRKRSRRGYESV